MPQAIAVAIITAVAASGVAAVAITIAVNIAFAVGMAMLTNALFGPKRPKPSDGQQLTRQSIGSRKRHYGIVHTGGQLTFEKSVNGTLGLVVTLGTGEEAEILEHRIHDKKVTLSGGTVTQERYRGAIHIYTRPGTADQTAIGELTAKFPPWTVNHRQRGCAHAAIICDPVKQEHFAEVYNSQMPAYTQVRKAAKLYDPRKDSTAGGTGAHRLSDPSTWEWSDNGPLVIADYVAHHDGYGLGYDNINWANIAAEADIADQQVLTVTGEEIARWRLWASYSMADDERRQVLTDMMKAVDGFCWQGADYKFNMMVGRFEEPDITITDDHIKAMSASLGPKAQARVSALKILYTEAAIGYREQESATVSDPNSPDDPNTSPQAVEVYYAPHHNQAARIGKLNVARLGNRWHIEVTLNLFGLNLLGRRFCRFSSAQLGVEGSFALESGVKLNIGTDEITVSATLVEVRAEDWEFDAVNEEGTPPIEPEVDDDDGSYILVPEPTGITLTAVQLALGATNAVAIEASWADPGRADLAFRARYRPVSGGNWVMMAVDNDARTARSGPVDSGVAYEVEVQAVTTLYRSSNWAAAAAPITPVATFSVGAPVFISAVGGVGEATVRFRLPVEPFAFARLYHSSTDDEGTMTQVGGDRIGGLGEVVEVVDGGLTSGAQHYWARAYSSSGGSSPLVGPVTATIS